MYAKGRAAAAHWGLLGCHWESHSAVTPPAPAATRETRAGSRATALWRDGGFVVHVSPRVPEWVCKSSARGNCDARQLGQRWGRGNQWGWSAFLWTLPLPTCTARTCRVIWFSRLTSVLKLRQAGCSYIKQLQWSWGQHLLPLVLNVSENTNCAEAQDKPKRARMCCTPFWFSMCSYLPWFNSESFLEAFISMETFE